MSDKLSVSGMAMDEAPTTKVRKIMLVAAGLAAAGLAAAGPVREAGPGRFDPSV